MNLARLPAQAATSHDPPGELSYNTTYYWQIVEVNEAEAVPAWTGEVWSFSTQEFELIEGFETYDDDIDAGTTIFGTWLDGWVNETGNTDLVGRFGTVVTPLRPAGTVEFGTERLQAVSEGAFIEAGAVVRVIEVHGNRIVVEQAEQTQANANA